MYVRDKNYIDDRLSAPCVAAGEAHDRLKKYDDALSQRLSNELMQAMQEFTDKCREIRNDLQMVKYGR
jgi:hypothetical protein